MNVHLSEEQFTDILLGLDENPAAKAHLETCSQCQEELARVEDAIGIFRQASGDWSRERVAAITEPKPGFFAKHGLSFTPVASLGVAAVLAIGVAIPFLRHADVPAAQQAVVHQAPVPTAAQIKEDNELLEAINDEISAPHSAVQPVVYSSDNRATLKR